MSITVGLLVLAALLGVLALQVYVVRDLRRIKAKLWRERKLNRDNVNNLFEQFQHLRLLEHEVGLQQPLPLTRGWAGSPDFLRFIADYVGRHHPGVVVECGSGVSTVVLAAALRRQGSGHLYSLEHDPSYAEKTRQLLRDYSLEAHASVIDAPLSSSRASTPWYDEASFPDSMQPIELLVVDGPPGSVAKQSRYPALEILMPRMAASFAVVLDDANRPDERRCIDRWLQDHPDLELSRARAEKGLAVLERRAPSADTLSSGWPLE